MSNSKPQTIVDAATSWYMRKLKNNPVPTKALTSASIAFFSNLIAQRVVERRRVDWSRVIKFAIWGLVSSPISHYWYIVLDRLFRNIKDKYQVYGKIIVDQLIYAPFINILFYVVTSLLDRKPNAIILKLYFSLLPTLKENWKIWPIAQIINFTYTPPHLRAMFTFFIEFIWFIMLSVVSKKKVE
ncbi:hypothetical protein SAMD00019534_085300 [Acytostelium subglobosum LB1]|uniref:hypothetical protein n=1 Tax=Acytostelium subglobosum LB1 TaxID=1410327 RepID=UPI000644A243|nr:hypothetical protein SAMD00019534_085300 [Acytostelium subglobosum LB1]GAM25355.1 hypothetical protein SAMD00019534_085300 [Acytostelium subglobosum LB1]|eukprot:XP_012751875.1 hypothetical protein SAMD00019534_085300 [Acytostelium subglobosum LB1]